MNHVETFSSGLVMPLPGGLDRAMTVKARTAADLVALHAEYLDGQTVAKFVVHGINSLKSMDVPLDALAGERVGAVTPTGEATFDLALGAHVLTVDLQRVGVVQWSKNLSAWSFGQPSMPTGQLLFEGGGGINFSEAAKTKRITFRISRA
ncbi:hypothetical protein FHP29_16425 [Nocardioides albidus]|uniref:Uncharacterized protein n=1 Tax=Nocardioides albidus TaxID=1517589 RepID=A0A5C4VNK1_9ACTN|nr:hypothetical protein [Nocardioides albidus]TNM37417.1 hypothetical protein FHP29_16425 [Nocardioides albidus]